MPRVSYFYGIIIFMYYDDHSPPHFHAVYDEHRAEVGINPIRILDGSLPRRAQGFVFEWAAMHQTELEENWQRARDRDDLERIAPLD